MSDYQDKSQQATHPGEVIAEALDDHSLSQTVLAKRLDVSEKHLSNLIQGQVSVTTDMAGKLALVFSTSIDFWLNLQKNYDIIKARIALEEQFEKEKELLTGYRCYKELSDIGYTTYSRNRFEKYENLLKFFGVARLSLVSKNYCVDFRNIATKPDVANAAAWLRCGEIDFNKIPEHREFDLAKFNDGLSAIRQLTSKDPSFAFTELVRICSESGVAVVYTPYISKTGLKGATRWMRGKPLIQLSEMHKRADAVWFSFFHEAAHIILKHSKKRSLIDWTESIVAKDKFEKQADEFAKNALIPSRKYAQFVTAGDFESTAIEGFAKKLGIGTDIVAGRLAYENLIPQALANQFVKPVEIAKSQGHTTGVS